MEGWTDPILQDPSGYGQGPNKLQIINMEFNHYRNGIHYDYTRCVTNFKRQYLYNKNKTGDSSNTYWQCVERRSGNGYGVRITLDQDEVFLTKLVNIPTLRTQN